MLIRKKSLCKKEEFDDLVIMVMVLVQVSKEFDSLLQVVELVQHLLWQGGTHLRPAQIISS
jgi:hypothetical protein